MTPPTRRSEELALDHRMVPVRHATVRRQGFGRKTLPLVAPSTTELGGFVEGEKVPWVGLVGVGQIGHPRIVEPDMAAHTAICNRKIRDNELPESDRKVFGDASFTVANSLLSEKLAVVELMASPLRLEVLPNRGNRQHSDRGEAHQQQGEFHLEVVAFDFFGELFLVHATKCLLRDFLSESASQMDSSRSPSWVHAAAFRRT